MTSQGLDPTEAIDYSTANTPTSYVCGHCGKSGVKLWRRYEFRVSAGTLYCCDCAAKEKNLDISTMNAEGVHIGNRGETDYIGGLVPAVPVEDNRAFWTADAIPVKGLKWWQNLPLR